MEQQFVEDFIWDWIILQLYLYLSFQMYSFTFIHDFGRSLASKIII